MIAERARGDRGAGEWVPAFGVGECENLRWGRVGWV